MIYLGCLPMDESLNARVFSKIIFAIFVVAIVDLFYINWWILNDGKAGGITSDLNKESNQGIIAASSTPIVVPSSSPSPTSKASFGGVISTKNNIVESQDKIVVQTAEKEIFIPLGTGFVTTSTFSDLSGVEVTIDSHKYPSIEGVYFEAAIYVEGGNGSASAQIYNVDDKTAYIESQISNNSATPAVKSSNKIPIASGSKTYRVQAKNEFGGYKAYVDNARLKIVIK